MLTWPGGGYLGRVPPGRVTPHPDLAGGTQPGYPPTGYPQQGTPPRQGTPCPLGRVHPPAGYPPWQGTPPAGPGRVPLLAGPGRVPPLGVCPMEFWVILQSIMGYGYPPRCLPHGILGNVAKHYGIWVPPPRCGQTENITFPHPSDAGGKNYLMSLLQILAMGVVMMQLKFLPIAWFATYIWKNNQNVNQKNSEPHSLTELIAIIKITWLTHIPRKSLWAQYLTACYWPCTKYEGR